MKILIINAGSSSLKFQIFETDGSEKKLVLLYKGLIDEIGKSTSRYREDFGNKSAENSCAIKNFDEGIRFIIKKSQEHKIIKNLDEIKAVGHRVVHGGEKYSQPIIITAEVEKDIQKLSLLAPLHNPANLAAIKSCRKIFKKIPHIAVFDTAFHQSMPEKAFLYALPYSYYQKMKIRRYGFHGTSHKYVSRETIQLLKKKQSRIVVCHLGNGSSLIALKNGESIDTSMGFTPLEGVPMGTRSGDIDPAIIFHLEQTLKISSQAISDILNHKSGLLGLSEMSSDMRTLWGKNEEKGAKRAMSVLAYRIAKYIGAYTAALNGLDALTFTGGIGENAWYLRSEICKYFGYLGLILHTQKNRENKVEIHDAKSKIKVYVIPTNEEKQMALELLKKIKTYNS